MYEAGGDTTDWLRTAERSSGWRRGYGDISGNAFGRGGTIPREESDGYGTSEYEDRCWRWHGVPRVPGIWLGAGAYTSRSPTRLYVVMAFLYHRI
jgi:hypothetical protein